MPEYTIKHEDVMAMFKSLVSNTTQAATQATIHDRSSLKSRILQVIGEDPFLSQKEIAEKLRESHNTVKYHVKSMKKAGVIKREGFSQKGKWVIL